MFVAHVRIPASSVGDYRDIIGKITRISGLPLEFEILMEENDNIVCQISGEKPEVVYYGSVIPTEDISVPFLRKKKDIPSDSRLMNIIKKISAMDKRDFTVCKLCGGEKYYNTLAVSIGGHFLPMCSTCFETIARCLSLDVGEIHTTWRSTWGRLLDFMLCYDFEVIVSYALHYLETVAIPFGIGDEQFVKVYDSISDKINFKNQTSSIRLDLPSSERHKEFLDWIFENSERCYEIYELHYFLRYRRYPCYPINQFALIPDYTYEYEPKNLSKVCRMFLDECGCRPKTYPVVNRKPAKSRTREDTVLPIVELGRTGSTATFLAMSLIDGWLFAIETDTKLDGFDYGTTVFPGRPIEVVYKTGNRMIMYDGRRYHLAYMVKVCTGSIFP